MPGIARDSTHKV